MIYLTPIALLVVLLGGCAHTRPFNPATPEGRAEVNAQAERHSTTVILASGERIDAQALRLDADEASWIDPKTGEARSVPLAEVHTVRFPAWGRGALEGLAIGAGIGAVLGLGAVVEGGYFSSRPFLLVGETMASGGIAGALVGVALGRTLYVPEPPFVGSATLIPVPSQADSRGWTPAPQASSTSKCVLELRASCPRRVDRSCSSPSQPRSRLPP